MKKSSTIMAVLSMLVAAPASMAQVTPVDGEEPDMFEGSNIFVCPDGKFESGCDMADTEKAVSLDAAALDRMNRTCLYQTKADCAVVAFGQMHVKAQNLTLSWQHMSLQPKDGPQAEMMVLFVNSTNPTPLSVIQVDGYFDAPLAARDEDGVSIIHIPARNRGLGSADHILFSDGNGWNWINAYDIERRVNKLLPEGFQIASPSFFNFREGTGFALVSRENDAGCCATGGKVYIDFEVADHDLKVSRIAFDETKPVGQTHYAPMEPQDTEAEGDKK